MGGLAAGNKGPTSALCPSLMAKGESPDMPFVGSPCFAPP